MPPTHHDEIWTLLPRDHLAHVARQGPEPIFATVSGAHLYGFASPDSDVDLRGAFLLPLRDLLRLHPPAETLTLEDETTLDLDWVAHDIQEFGASASPSPTRPSSTCSTPTACSSPAST